MVNSYGCCAMVLTLFPAGLGHRVTLGLSVTKTIPSPRCPKGTSCSTWATATNIPARICVGGRRRTHLSYDWISSDPETGGQRYPGNNAGGNGKGQESTIPGQETPAASIRRRPSAPPPLAPFRLQ